MIFTFTSHSYGYHINYGIFPLKNNVLSTDLTVNNIHGTSNHYTFLNVYLSDYHGKPLSNKEIIYKIDGDPHSYVGVTSITGHAILYYYIFQKQGTYIIKADFLGDEKFSASTSTGMLTVL
jgi:hypothetical protein